MTRTEIRDLLQKHQKADRISESLELLEDSGLARCETSETGGRPVERWFSNGVGMRPKRPKRPK